MRTIKERYVVDETGARVGVLLSIEDYRRLLQALEEAGDALAIQETRARLAHGEETVHSWEEVEAGLETQDKLAWAELEQLIADCAMDTGIPDLAHQHDHYLYGTPGQAFTSDHHFEQADFVRLFPPH
jgi:hypothetical protein